MTGRNEPRAGVDQTRAALSEVLVHVDREPGPSGKGIWLPDQVKSEKSDAAAITVNHTISGRREQHATRHPRLLYAANVPGFFHKFLLPYADHFRRKGWQVDAMSKGFVDYTACNLLHRFDNTCEVDWARKPHQLRDARNIVNRIRTIAREGDYDLIHVHTPVAAMVTRFALRKRRHRRETKVIYTAHGFHFFSGAPRVSGAVFKRLEATASAWTDYLVVMNEEDLAAAYSLNRLPRERIVYMPGIGVDLSQYATTSAVRVDARAELGIGPDGVMFLCVAEFIKRKRQADVLYALQQIANPHLRVVFAGDGQMLRQSRDLAARLGVEGQTDFLGLRLDIPRLLAAADCVVLPSSQEGLPRSVMEAMCAGVPVIATDVRGTRELLGGDIGTLYPTGNIGALAAAMGRFAAAPEESRRRAAYGKDHVKKYDIDITLRMHEDLYAAALGMDRDAILPTRAAARSYLT